MLVSNPVNTKRRGRPPGQEFPVSVQLRLSTLQAKALDDWRASLENAPSRSEAIRLLVEDGLTALGKLPFREDPELAN